MSQRAQVDEAAFIYDWEAGVSTAVMGARYGVSDSTVSKIARRMGLAARRSDAMAPFRPVTHPGYALTGGQWVTVSGIRRWQPVAAPDYV